MDLHFLPLVRHEGQDQAELPGLHIAVPPRRMARGRQSDRLILYFTMEGNAPLVAEQQEQLIRRLVEVYYKTPGSVTAALRNVIENLNQYLLDRNLRAASTGRQGLGLLTSITLRDDRLILAQSGSVAAYLLTADEVQHIVDLEPTRRGLGLGRTAPLSYAQMSLSDNDVLLVSHQPPAAWNENLLTGLHGQGLESLHRHLVPAAGDGLAAVLIQARPGPGKTFLLHPKPLPISAEQVTPQPSEVIEEAVPAIEETPTVDEPLEMSPPPEAVTWDAPPADVPPMQAAPALEDELISPPSTTPPPVSPTYPEEETPELVSPVRGARRRTRRSLALPVLATISRAFGTAFSALSQSLSTLFKRMLPGEGSLPAPVMLLTAVIVPLIVVAVATVIYFQSGVAGQYQGLYAQAVQAAGAAQAENDPLARERAWQTVLEKLDQADAYQVTSDTQALRDTALQAIDELNLAIRLDFQPAIIEGLPSGSQVTRIVATETDLYLLDSSTGVVVRAIFAGRGYDIDKTYQCGPGAQGSQGIGPLVDIHLYPKPDGSGTALLGMDGQGNLLECSPGAPPLFTLLASPPAGWAGPNAFTIHAGDAYVLDPGTKQVWVYRNGSFSTPPDLFFDQDIPPLEDAIDLAAGQEDLFLLHQDGHITLCSIGSLGVVATQCTDPQPYADARPGRSGLPLTPPAPFIEVRSTQPPDPSLYLLEAGTPGVYHFSLRLAYQRQLRLQMNLVTRDILETKSATAFALSPDGRVMFLAFGDEVLYAGMP
ncbi:MAG TPA: hypothetical protein VIS10_06000 [Anaerolineales bacterium]